MSDIAETLRCTRDRLYQLALLDTILTREDLIEAVRSVGELGHDIAIRIGQRPTDRPAGAQALPKDPLIASMSFRFCSRTLLTAEDENADQKGRRRPSGEKTAFDKRLEAFGPAARASIHACVYARPESGLGVAELDLIADVADLVYAHSLPFRNIARDRRIQLTNDLRETVIDKPQRNRRSDGSAHPESSDGENQAANLEELGEFLRQQLDLRLEILTLAPTADGGHEPQLYNPKKQAQPFCAPVLAHPAFSAKIVTAIKSTKPFDVLIQEPKHDGHANEAPGTRIAVIPLRSYVDPGLRKNEAFVVSRRDGFLPHHEEINSINRCIDLFLARKYRLGQIDALTLYSEELEKALLSPPLTGYSEFEHRLKAILHEIAKRVVDSTAAYSMAVLEHSPHVGTLNRFELYEHDVAERIDSVDENASTVHLTQSDCKLSAFAYKNAHRSKYFYVPNTKRIPDHFQKWGLKEVISKRRSGSEIAIPIKRGELVLGVVNFEAKSQDAFSGDEEFLLAITRGISSLITCYYLSSDSRWLLDNIHVLELFHETRSRLLDFTVFLEGTKTSQRSSDVITQNITDIVGQLDEVSEKLDEVLARGQISDEISEVPLQTTFKEIFDRHLRHYAGAATIRFPARTALRVSQMHAAGTTVILKNLIENVKRYATEGDALFVSIDSIRAMGRNLPILRVLMYSYDWRDDLALDKAFVAPVRNRYGLYIVGVVTRALKGKLAFTRTHVTGATTKEHVRLDIEVPLV